MWMAFQGRLLAAKCGWPFKAVLLPQNVDGLSRPSSALQPRRCAVCCWLPPGMNAVIAGHECPATLRKQINVHTVNGADHRRLRCTGITDAGYKNGLLLDSFTPCSCLPCRCRSKVQPPGTTHGSARTNLHLHCPN
jgi:hypothetical protein